MNVWRLACCGCLLPSAATAADDGRQELSLNGTWQYLLVAELAAPPMDGAWKIARCPGTLQGTDYQRAWRRRSFETSPAMRGQRIKIHFGGFKYHSQVWLNGRQVGGCFGGYEPFDVDVTDAVRFDGPNELLVGCHDWTRQIRDILLLHVSTVEKQNVFLAPVMCRITMNRNTSNRWDGDLAPRQIHRSLAARCLLRLQTRSELLHEIRQLRPLLRERSFGMDSYGGFAAVDRTPQVLAPVARR
jgi:hypothetical protein